MSQPTGTPEEQPFVPPRAPEGPAVQNTDTGWEPAPAPSAPATPAPEAATPEQPQPYAAQTAPDPQAQAYAAQQPSAGYQQQSAYPQAGYQQPAQQYAAPGYYGAQDQILKSLQNQGVIALVLGILGFVGFGPLTSIPAWIIGNSCLAKARESGIPEDLVKNAYYGKILGMIGTILLIIALVFIGIFILIVFIAAMNSGSIDSLAAL